MDFKIELAKKMLQHKAEKLSDVGHFRGIKITDKRWTKKDLIMLCNLFAKDFIMIHLSASSIATFKACPYRYYYQYVLGLRPIVDTDALRMGTNWHRIQEIANMQPCGVCECMYYIDEKDLPMKGDPDPNCVLCDGNGILPDDLMDAVTAHLNQAYAEIPLSKTEEEWEVEKIKFLYSLVGYQWYWNDDDYEGESLEQKFSLPLLSPISGRKLKAELRGKIDRIFSAGDNRFIHEYKSTSASLDSDSTFWSHLTLDTQTRMYTYAARQLGLGACGVLYDVWHKPQIKPKKLTQGESKKFVEDGEYCGEKFEIGLNESPIGTGAPDVLLVNKREAQVESGAKEGTFAIRETPEMYGARLLQDITQRPEFYFARREVVHHDDDIDAFTWELFNIYKSIQSMSNKNTFWRNEHQCEATFKCDYIDWCYSHRDIGPDEVPDNFRKIGVK